MATAAVAVPLTATAASAAPAASPALTSCVECAACIVTTDGLGLRTGPGTGYAIRGLLYKGDTVQRVRPLTNGWYMVELTSRSKGGLPAGTEGWVSSRYLNENCTSW